MNISKYIALFVFSILLTFPCFNTAAAQEHAEKPATENVAGDTRIEVDHRKDMIRFYVKGEEVMRLDDLGLHVKYQLNYGTNLVDVGPYVFPAVRGEADNEK